MHALHYGKSHYNRQHRCFGRLKIRIQQYRHRNRGSFRRFPDSAAAAFSGSLRFSRCQCAVRRTFFRQPLRPRICRIHLAAVINRLSDIFRMRAAFQLILRYEIRLVQQAISLILNSFNLVSFFFQLIHYLPYCGAGNPKVFTQLLSGNIFPGFPQETQRLGSLIFQHIVFSHSSCRFHTIRSTLYAFRKINSSAAEEFSAALLCVFLRYSIIHSLFRFFHPKLYAPSVAAITALIVCIRFSASSNTLDCADSNTSSVTSISFRP